MKRLFAITLLVMPLLLGAACNQTATVDGDTTAPSIVAEEKTPEQLGELGALIRKEPDRAEEILSQHGMTLQSFEESVRKIAENPEESKQYAEAFRRSSA
jgi:hypothetical protein